MRIIAFINDGAEIRKILEYIGVDARPPKITPPRGPPLLAAENGRTAILQALLRAGAKVDYARSGSWRALLFAAENGHTATVHAMLDAGANCNMRDKSGLTALDLALPGKYDRVIELLRANGADSIPPQKNIIQKWFG